MGAHGKCFQLCTSCVLLTILFLGKNYKIFTSKRHIGRSVVLCWLVDTKVINLFQFRNLLFIFRRQLGIGEYAKSLSLR